MPSCKYKEPIIRTCALCGEKSAFTSANQKYCKACAKEMKNNRSIRTTEERKNAHNNPKPPIVPSKSIEDMCKLSEKYGISYGKVELMLRKEGA